MKRSLTVSVVLGVLMLSSAGLAKVLTPTAKLADRQDKFNLDAMVPQAFGDWQIDTSIVPVQVDPETQATIDKLYNQILTRTYVNGRGERVMLSIAYGGDQSDTMGLHRPEVCYAAQGFDIKQDRATELVTDYGTLPIRRLHAVNGGRSEPITYWITVGNKTIKPGISQKFEQVRLGLTGLVPDGMLVRVSTIDPDIAGGYQVQDRFVKELLLSVDARARVRLIGVFGG